MQHELGTTRRAHKFYSDQMSDSLNDEMIEFIGRMDMAFIATADANGEADCSFRAGPAGFIQVLDAGTICYPEYRGNGVMASLGNISENPHVGIMMLDFVRDRIGLHINGRASIVTDDEMRAQVPDLPEETIRGRIPDVWVRVDVHEAYIHCRKHIPALVPAASIDRAWGTDNPARKGGDYFGVTAQRKAERDEVDEAG